MTEAVAVLAERLAGEVRSLAGIDPVRLAEALGVAVETRSMSQAVLGATPSRTRIVLNACLDENSRRSVLAHELGHVLAKLGRARLKSQLAEERFADAFAAALLIPADALVEPVDPGVSAAEFSVTPEVVLMRARSLGLRIIRCVA